MNAPTVLAAKAPSPATESTAAGTAGGQDQIAANEGTCPEDCHYCSGPETD